MTKIFSLSMSLLLAVLFSSCAKGTKTDNVIVTPQSESPVAVDLSGKTLADILIIKYKSAVLKCDLWTQQSTQLNISGSPTDSVSWDLKSGAQMPPVLKLVGQIKDHQIAVEVNLTSVFIYDYYSLETSDNLYTLKFSPAIKASISYKAETYSTSGPVTVTSDAKMTEFHEKINIPQINDTLGTEPEKQGNVSIDKGSIRDYATCYIESDLKPQYEDQYEEKKTN